MGRLDIDILDIGDVKCQVWEEYQFQRHISITQVEMIPTTDIESLFL